MGQNYFENKKVLVIKKIEPICPHTPLGPLGKFSQNQIRRYKSLYIVRRVVASLAEKHIN